MIEKTTAIELRYYLVHLGTSETVQVINPVMVGREEGDFTFPDDASLSKKHFRVWIQQNQCMLEDLGSTNKTFVSGKTMAQRQPVALSFGDEIEAGSQKFTIQRNPVAAT